MYGSCGDWTYTHLVKILDALIIYKGIEGKLAASDYTFDPAVLADKFQVLIMTSLFSGCVYYGFITTLLGITQISLLATIALDRYLVIVRPSHVTIGMNKAVTMVMCCYGYGFLWALLPGNIFKSF